MMATDTKPRRPSPTGIGLPLEDETTRRSDESDGDADGMDGILRPATRSTPSNGNEATQHQQQQQQQQRLVDRVTELETKLAVLSRLWQRQQQTQRRLGNDDGARFPQAPTPPPIRIAAGMHPSPPLPNNNNNNRSVTPPASFTTVGCSGTVDPVQRFRDGTPPPPLAPPPLPSSSYVPPLESPAPLHARHVMQLDPDTDGEDQGSAPTPPLLQTPELQDRDTDALETTVHASNRTGNQQSTPELPEENDAFSNELSETSESSTVHKRNLSFRLLFDGDEQQYDMEHRMQSIPPTTSMTPAERQWLQPKLQQYLESEKKKKKKKKRNASTSSSATSEKEPFDERATASNDDVDDTFLQERERTNWLNYLNSFQEESNRDVDLQMQEFIKVPPKVESIMSFGLLVCVDSFLYMITILPIRFVWSCLLLLLHGSVYIPFVTIWKNKSPDIEDKSRTPQPKRRRSQPPIPFRFHRRHSYQLIQVGIVYSIYRFVLSEISIGKLYHWIRGQSMIKLYVLIAIVEVFDRLFSSLGQDCLDSLYWNTVNRPGTPRMIVSVVVVWVYAMVHALFLFVHVETLNVAMNSADQALLTLLISGNFAEIKSTVFKKYNKPALFKITASDICERFKLGLFLSLILMMNVCQGMEEGQFADFLRICGIVWCAELLSDWIKHSFITKFNFLPSKVYVEYSLLLAGDVTGIGHEGFNVDHSHAVVKRIGFAQIPLVCVMFRLLREATKYARRNPYLRSTSILRTRVRGTAFCVAGWLFLLATKMLLGRLLQRTSLAKLRAAPEVIASTKKQSKQKKS